MVWSCFLRSLHKTMAKLYIYKLLSFRWCGCDTVRSKLADSASNLKSVRYPLAVNQLVPLPKDYSELINRVSTFTYVSWPLFKLQNFNSRGNLIVRGRCSYFLQLRFVKCFANFFSCPKSDGDDSRAPTMCLVCGKMLCSQSYCCQTELNGQSVGAATAHAHFCGAGTGVFLRCVSFY